MVKPNKRETYTGTMKSATCKQLPLESRSRSLNQKGHEFRMQTTKSLHKIHAKTAITTKSLALGYRETNPDAAVAES
jgi:hypothetical protein